MIAMALMCQPDLIIADEPTTALDVTIQAQILHLLADLQREFHMGLVLITHDLGIVARIATRVVVMYAGEVVEAGSAARHLPHVRAHPYTRGLLDCIPIPGTHAARRAPRHHPRHGAVAGRRVPGMPLRGPLRARHRRPAVRRPCRSSDDRRASGHQVRCIRARELAATAMRPRPARRRQSS